jgi:hypothetical protein
MSERPFQFYAPLTFFEKGDAPAGQKRRIAGIISTELRDKQGEVLVQKGLDFGPFLKTGWFNDNHSKRTTDVLGYPQDVKQFRKGAALPDGSTAPANLTWAEGYLLETPEADKVWSLAQALQKAGGDRRLGYSVEGGIVERAGADQKTVVKAVVRNVAITNCPVGEHTRLEALAKSLEAAQEDVDRAEKGLSMGAPTPGVNPSAAGPTTGEGAGKVLTPAHLESEEDEEAAEKKKPLTKSSAVEAIQNRLACNRTTAERAFAALFQPRSNTMTGINQTELEKGLRRLEASAKAPQARAADLFNKAQDGSITPEEREELIKSVSTDLGQRATNALAESDTIKKSLDVSDYLREQHLGVVTGLETLAGHIEKSEARDQEFRIALASTLFQMGELVKSQVARADTAEAMLKSVTERLGIIAAQPARGPKSVAGAQHAAANSQGMNKSFAGQPAEGDRLSKGQINEALTEMLMKGTDTVGGESLVLAAAKYESLNEISPDLFKAVVDHVRSGKTKAA